MKQKVIRIATAALLLVAAIAVEELYGLPMWGLLLVYLVPYLVAGHDVLLEAAGGLAKGDLCNEDFLMCVATIGALAIGFLPGAGAEFAEAVFVMLFFQVGELLEDYAEAKSHRSISHLMDIRPDTATVIYNNVERNVAATSVAVGDTLIVKPGERVPLDGIVTGGTSNLDTVALTGESQPRGVGVGEPVLSGCINLSGVLKVRVEKAFGDSTASRIIQLVEGAAERKSRSETFIARFARVYTPVVVAAALVVAFVPPLFCESYLESLAMWVGRALTLLVVSCPCALVISVPLTFFAGIGGASRQGILIKGASFMDALARTTTVVFDKTGTLTEGRFKVTAVHPDKTDAGQLLHLAAHVERHSTHPIALSLKEAFPEEDDGCTVEQVEEVAGQGVRALVNGHAVCVGNSRMMQATGAPWHDCHHVGTIVHVSIDGTYAGHIVIADQPKDDAAEAIQALRALGVRKTVMLTGDRHEVASDIASRLGLSEHHAELLPAGKVEWTDRLLACKGNGKALAFVGDGVNDAPVLARADVGIAMGALGSDAAIEAADVVLMDDKPSKVATAIRLSRRTIGIASQNVVLAVGVKVGVLALAAIGAAGMGMAVFADVGVMVLCVLNAMRALGTAAR